MKTTLKDIANRVGVTSQLVSFYLNHPDTTRVAKATRDKIDAAIRELEYRPNGVARALSTGKTRTLGLILGGFTIRKRGCFVHALMNAAKQHGYHLLIAITNYDQSEEREALEYMLAQQVDGILYHLYLDPESSVYKRLKETRYPILMHVPQAHDDFNTIGHEPEAMLNGLRALAARGHRKILYVGGSYVQEHDLLIRLAKERNVEMAFPPQSSYLDLAAFVKEEKFTAVFSVNNWILDDFLRRCPDLKVEVVASYSLPYEYSGDPRIVGWMCFYFRRRAEREIERILEIIKDPTQPPRLDLLPSEYRTSEEILSIYQEQSADEYYKDFR